MVPLHDNGKLWRRVPYWNFLNYVNRVLAAKLNSKPLLLSVIKCFLKVLLEGVWSLLFSDSQNQEKVSAHSHGGARGGFSPMDGVSPVLLIHFCLWV